MDQFNVRPVGRPEWPDELFRRVAIRWLDGTSAGTIALEYGISRSAIIGKMHREGIVTPNSNRERNAGGRRLGSKDSKPRQRVVKSAERTAEEELVLDLAIPLGQRRSIYQLTDACCHWPVGDPQGADFFFCGASVEAWGPYCARHHRVAHDYVRLRKLNPAFWGRL